MPRLGRKCVYPNCGHYQNINKCSFRAFPKCNILTGVWLARCGLTAVTPKRVTPSMFLCSCHFPGGKNSPRPSLPDVFVELYGDDEVELVHQGKNPVVDDAIQTPETNHVTQEQSFYCNTFISESPTKRSMTTNEPDADEPPRKRTVEEVTPSTRLAIDCLLSLPMQQHHSVETSQIDLENSAETVNVMDRTKKTPSGQRLSFTPKSKLWKLMEASAMKKRKMQRKQLLRHYSSMAQPDSDMSKNPSFESASIGDYEVQRQSTMNSFGEDANNFFMKQTPGSACESVSISTETAQVVGGVRSVSVQCPESEEKEIQKEKEKSGSGRPQKRHSLCLNISYEKCRHLPETDFQFFLGVTQSVFEIVYEFLGGDKVCDNLKYQYDRKTPSTRTKNAAAEEVQLKSKDKLLLTLLRLRRGIPLRDLGVLFSISEGWASKIFYTWIRFMGIQFSRLDKYIFVSAESQEKNKPECFEPFENLRVVIDATELKIQRPKHLQQQSNTFSDYKSCNTVKFLVGISCYGGLSFISEAYEGSISDRKLLVKSGLLDHLVEGDSVMADRGFDVEDLLNEMGVDLIIPAFLGKREAFTARELVASKMIASARIHVETFIGKVKQFRLMRFALPSNMLLPYVSDMMKICAYLVNFNAPFVKFDS